MYFLSERLLNEAVLRPRIPESMGEDEEETIPRVCVAPSISGCLSSIGPGRFRIGSDGKPEEKFPRFYAYKTEKSIEGYKHYSWEHLVKMNWVPDAVHTLEHWVLEDVEIRLIGMINITDHRKVALKDRNKNFQVNCYQYELVEGYTQNKGVNIKSF